MISSRPEDVAGPAPTSSTVYPAVESIDRLSLPPPPYAAALSFPKADEGQPPSYQMTPSTVVECYRFLTLLQSKMR